MPAPIETAIQSLAQRFFRPPGPVPPGGPGLPARLPEDDTNPFMVIMDAVRGALVGAEDSPAAKAGTLGAALVPVVGGFGSLMNDFRGLKAAETAAGAVPEVRQGIKAYHGSPHDFERFDLSKIGTGEGAQSYGHGLYFAEHPDVADSYRKQLSGFVPAGWSDRFPASARGYINGIVGDIADGKLTAAQAAKYVSNANAEMRGYPPAQLASELEDAARSVKGRMYEVNIKADPSQLLDWDKPFSQQSDHARAALVKALPWIEKADPERIANAPIPAILHEADLGSPADVSAALRSAGIPGTQYLDQVSRQVSGEGTRNYVVFDDALIDILRKYGIPAALSSAVAQYLQRAQPEASQ